MNGEFEKLISVCERAGVGKRSRDSIPQYKKKWYGNQCIIIIITIEFDGIFESASAITPLGKICTLMPLARPGHTNYKHRSHSTLHTCIRGRASAHILRCAVHWHMCNASACSMHRTNEGKCRVHEYTHIFKNQSIKFHLMHPKTISPPINSSTCTIAIAISTPFNWNWFQLLLHTLTRAYTARARAICKR